MKISKTLRNNLTEITEHAHYCLTEIRRQLEAGDELSEMWLLDMFHALLALMSRLAPYVPADHFARQVSLTWNDEAPTHFAKPYPYTVSRVGTTALTALLKYASWWRGGESPYSAPRHLPTLQPNLERPGWIEEEAAEFAAAQNTPDSCDEALDLLGLIELKLQSLRSFDWGAFHDAPLQWMRKQASRRRIPIEFDLLPRLLWHWRAAHYASSAAESDFPHLEKLMADWSALVEEADKAAQVKSLLE